MQDEKKIIIISNNIIVIYNNTYAMHENWKLKIEKLGEKKNLPGSSSAARTTEVPTAPRAKGSYEMRA